MDLGKRVRGNKQLGRDKATIERWTEVEQRTREKLKGLIEGRKSRRRTERAEQEREKNKQKEAGQKTWLDSVGKGQE